MSRRQNRREFLRNLGAAGLVAGSMPRVAQGRAPTPGEALNVGIIGTSHRGAANIAGVTASNVNIVALCDIDDDLLGQSHERFPRARTYNDFRKLVEQKDVEAVVISTPDHIHAPAALAALRLGKHVYCEKPLSHTAHEARLMAETAARMKVATQMGTQAHAYENYRRVVELIQAGAIGPVREVHVWVAAKYAGGDRPSESPPVPPGLHWDLWLGPAPERPYHSAYQPFRWRGWWDFGCGALGDMACHYLDLPFWALGLGHPISVEAEGPPVHPESTPSWLIVGYEFPARGDLPPVKLTWYDSGKRPALFAEGKLPVWGDGVLFVGENGMLLSGYKEHRLLPESQFRDFEPPPRTVPASIGHHTEWVEACRTGRSASCHFGYSGMLTEVVHLGNIAYRVGRKLEWDAAGLKAVGCAEADRYIRKEYRKGWEL